MSLMLTDTLYCFPGSNVVPSEGVRYILPDSPLSPYNIIYSLACGSNTSPRRKRTKKTRTFSRIWCLRRERFDRQSEKWGQVSGLWESQLVNSHMGEMLKLEWIPRVEESGRGGVGWVRVEQEWTGWRTSDSTRTSTTWPAFKSRRGRHTWVEFAVAVCSLVGSKRIFLTGYFFASLLKTIF